MFGNGTFTANRTNSVNTNTKLTTLYADDSMVIDYFYGNCVISLRKIT